MAQFDAKKFAESQPKKETLRKEKGSGKRNRSSRLSGERKKRQLPQLLRRRRTSVRKHWLLSPRPGTPKSTFVLDEFKHNCFQEVTLSVVLPYFWEHFDKDGWSLWYAEYHFPEELTQTFINCNLIAGMFQRLDTVRKNAFASVIIFGTNSSSISGVWVFRGQELAFSLSPDWQVNYES